MNGVNRSWYENGKPYRECQVVKGLPNGKFVEYHPDGRTAEISYYKNGELDGKLEKYYENGQLRAIQHFADGKLTGEMVGYHPNGRLAEKYTFEHRERSQPAYSTLPTATSVRRPLARETTNS